MISSYPSSLALAAANSLSVSAPFWCSAASASSSEEIAGAATTTPWAASPVGYQHLCFIGVAGSWMPIVSSVA